jgi:hypothetical protein
MDTLRDTSGYFSKVHWDTLQRLCTSSLSDYVTQMIISPEWKWIPFKGWILDHRHTTVRAIEWIWIPVKGCILAHSHAGDNFSRVDML